MRPIRHNRGVTLIELVIVIAISAIIAGSVAVFISRPFEGYVDSARRAELTDIADTALRRITRDLRTALPNSIRTASVGGTVYLEYLQTSGGGRYRAELTSTGAGDVLDFTGADNSFDVIGVMPAVANGDSIVVYNLAATGTVANAYSDDNRATASGGSGSTITLSAAKHFPHPSPGKRFQVVPWAVTYECNPTTGQLRRYWNYGFAAAQATPPATGNVALLATDVKECAFEYSDSVARVGVVRLFLKVERNGESVRLFQQVHVNNAP